MKRKRADTDDGENGDGESMKIIEMSDIKLKWHIHRKLNGGDLRRQYLINSVIERCGGKKRKIVFACAKGQRDIRNVLDRIENKRFPKIRGITSRAI